MSFQLSYDSELHQAFKFVKSDSRRRGVYDKKSQGHENNGTLNVLKDLRQKELPVLEKWRRIALGWNLKPL